MYLRKDDHDDRRYTRLQFALHCQPALDSMVAIYFSCRLLSVHAWHIFICTIDPELSGSAESDSYLALHAPDMADPFVLVVLCMGGCGLDILFHDHRHDICRSGMGSGMVLVHLSPDQGVSVPERRYPDALSGGINKRP